MSFVKVTPNELIEGRAYFVITRDTCVRFIAKENTRVRVKVFGFDHRDYGVVKCVDSEFLRLSTGWGFELFYSAFVGEVRDNDDFVTFGYFTLLNEVFCQYIASEIVNVC